MPSQELPSHYLYERQEHREFIDAVEHLGKVVRKAGPIEEKSAHLIQLAAAIAIDSEGAAHSHVRRALACGASPEEIFHSIILLTSTLGYPTVSKALSWAEDVIPGRGDGADAMSQSPSQDLH
ncbi:carboxymuconolactone decarboxylase family protein [Oxalobacteraceae bacterium OM1]|nr:carboxymuconolactone decarboxylase family protein [Oxalobacteraceae bacterium OM1]